MGPATYPRRGTVPRAHGSFVPTGDRPRTPTWDCATWQVDDADDASLTAHFPRRWSLRSWLLANGSLTHDVAPRDAAFLDGAQPTLAAFAETRLCVTQVRYICHIRYTRYHA